WIRAKGQGARRVEIPADPPFWSIAAVADRGLWPGVRHLSGIVEVPTMRPDGTLLDAAGYDGLTGLLFEPNDDYPPVPQCPSLAHAQNAAGVLLDLVDEFEFAGDAHKAAWLAALLTVLARPAIDGPCPLFLFEAAAAGTGKTLLAEINGI